MVEARGIMRRLSLRGKLILFMVVIVVVASFFNLYFYSRVYSSMDDYNHMLQDYTEVNNLSIELIQTRDSLARYVSLDSDSTGNKVELSRYNEYLKQTEDLADTVYISANSLDTYLLSKAIKNSIEAFKQEVGKILSANSSSEENYLQFLRVKDDSLYIDKYIKELLNIKLSEGEWRHQQLTIHVNTIRFVNWVSIWVITVLSLIYIAALSNSITIPIKKLTQFARNISKGDFENRELELNSSDDINILAATLNKMSKNIQNMIFMERQLHEDELERIKISNELNKAKFLALQSQINPHFLFNTLNAVARFAMFEGAKKTVVLIESLSGLFRYNLKSGEEVLLEDELKIIKQYSTIQNARFGERFKFNIVCSADISNVRVPRFIIQPLVENAVMHGLECKESGGEVRIKIYERSGKLMIKVIDNGIGISSERLKHLLDSSNETTNIKGHTSGIGLNNVRERMMLYYKSLGCFSMKSKENLGTVITLSIDR